MHEGSLHGVYSVKPGLWTEIWTDAQFNDDHFQETADRSIEIEGTTMQASQKELALRLLA